MRILDQSRLNVAEKTIKEEEEEGEAAPIQWSNVIFVPFHPVFKLIVLLSVITKTVIGPMQAVFPHVICTDILDSSDYLFHFKYFYLYICDPIYGIDTFLHIVHRQVTEEAMRREFLPKSALLLTLDIISLIPFFRLISTESCPPAQFYPNIIAFSESIVIYRVVQYFDWKMTHSIGKTLICFTLLSALIINILTCFLLLLTVEGLCDKCNESFYDWRSFVYHRFNQTDNEDISTYIYGSSFILSFFLHKLVDELKPNTYTEFKLSILFMIIGYLLYVFVLVPKIFNESLLSIRRICTFHPRVSRIIDETKRRNPSPNAHVAVEKFYALIWSKRKGITSIPEIIAELPRYLRTEIRQDLVWPVFYHSPTFRKTSESFKRWLCDRIHLDYKLPGERFFAGPNCFTNLYYLKSGIVQFISSDDSNTAVLTVTGGTVFGDISFVLPPLKRRLIVRCLTYCEVFLISRSDIVKSLHKFPEDRHLVMNLANERIKHARSLYKCKQNVKGIDRSENEGISWIKRRWWEISRVLSRRIATKKDRQKTDLPAEESSYHCAKFIGQLVLCTNVQLQRKSMFANVGFPWILLPQSSFGAAWNRIVIFTVYLVLIFYPPNLSRNVMLAWFKIMRYYVDLVYICDIVVSLMTALDGRESISTSFATVMFARFKTWYFILDVLSTVWIENLVIIIGLPDLYQIAQFNRLIKVYMLFTKRYNSDWKVKESPMVDVFFKIVLIHFCFAYVLAYFFFLIEERNHNISLNYLFGTTSCSQKGDSIKYDEKPCHVLEIAISWTFELTFSEYPPSTFLDVGIGMALSFVGYITFMYTKLRFMAALYLKLRNMANYHCFVSNLKQHYLHHKIHKDLLRRLNRFLLCHWNYYHGIDVMSPNLLKDEPYDIYWKLHGEKAEKLIGENPAFLGADIALVRELAHKAKFLIIPRKTVLFLVGVRCKNVTWVANGIVKCEYHNENGDLVKAVRTSGQLLSFGSVFLGQPALRTFTASSDSEILYLKRNEFLTIMKRFPSEWAHLETCLEEFGPAFKTMFETYIMKHKDYQRNVRDHVFHARRTGNVSEPRKTATNSSTSSIEALSVYNVAKTRMMNIWLLLRAITVMIQITCAALQGGSGAGARRPLTTILNICKFVCFIDIIMKFAMAYYDERGLLIKDIRKCVVHYGTRGLIMDIIGILPWHIIYINVFSKTPDENEALLLDTISSFAHIYIVLGYFDYIADTPTVNYAFVLIAKWQVFTVLLMLGTSHYFISKCIAFKWDDHQQLLNMQKRNGCWLPPYNKMFEKPTIPQLHVLFAQSLNLAQCGLMRLNLGKFFIFHEKTITGLIFITLGIIFWYLMNVSESLLILKSRGNTMFQHGVSQLSRFLKAERVDKALIDRAESHFTYWWIRTKGLNVRSMIHERIGVVFRQDLSYYFYKRTFQILDTLLHGGAELEHQLAGSQTQLYFLPQEDIMREMDLTPYVYVIHRGKVNITQNGKHLALLTKGTIFGQLQGTKVRPIRVTANAQEHADVLQIPIKLFQEAISDKVRENIALNNESANDYMALKKIVPENPYNTVQYILRGRKTIWLPWMTKPIEAHTNKWYHRWLFCVWLVGPTITAILVLIQKSFPPKFKADLNWCLVQLDFLHFVHMIANFYTTQLLIKDNKCVHQYMKLKKITQWSFYFDVASIVVPMITMFTENWNYQLARLLRLHLFFEFHEHFCKNFQAKASPILLKFVLLLLLTHALTCGWMTIACRRELGEPFPLKTYPLPAHINKSIDFDEWVLPSQRIDGCPRLTKGFERNNKSVVGFVVPRKWEADYVLALAYILVMHTTTNMDHMAAITLEQIYYKIFMTMILYLVEMWISSLAISAIYTKLRELYLYDYRVSNLITYLKHNGLSMDLLSSVKKYTSQLWARQRGYWLPEITVHAPICLREDMFSELYMHHLEKPTLFHQLPPYFLRQLVARLQRVVVFPGKCIVQEGDIHPTMYFIHEGEVEKWYTDDESGDSTMVSLLLTNSYFGLIPGLFPDSTYHFSYYTRTVVDFVYLKHDNWQDLLDGYPEVKADLYEAANKLKHTVTLFN